MFLSQPLNQYESPCCLHDLAGRAQNFFVLYLTGFKILGKHFSKIRERACRKIATRRYFQLKTLYSEDPLWGGMVRFLHSQDFIFKEVE